LVNISSFLSVLTGTKLDALTLLCLANDAELRSEFLDNEKGALPSSVAAQDLSFVELMRWSSEETPECRDTCVSGFTVVCDGTILPNCRFTCVTSYTLR
jgi:hypothetical protein